ncbi:hypothetical protein ACN23B_03435 [Anabaena sp. FACHB-709]|uniref:ABC transmembrane type-1 domain-containing protein n=2 Tax=Nostocaceae TaxID=1162 RepID=A0A1Z4KRL3_ANAVA|nr:MULTISPECIES: hypothetical protein [Nostocaceae]BAY71665.1 hypothetical protein NIES23_44850 [Trichormus variabilis NIES-23]HBW32328.1 hypothetical protein [Nostoc sp. UBA8866]MBD2172512.1 hypothetical protein [Anabaena cylindrica FACHB-318]MBD2264021.1 hypothetical protein [Anabaena sp. FACHB-709]MBD2273451.1 hypothetical protein [Nostoc sp. PCC 7120 = FACHB-418]
MNEFFSNSHLREFLINMVTSDVTFITGLFWLVVATLISMIGGAIGGMVLAGKDIGYGFSATIGALFAPAGVIPAIVLGLGLLSFLSNY